MPDLHIDEFYKDAATVLARLYAAFPRKTSVYVEDVAGDDHPDEFGLHSTRHLACFGAMVWLAEEGWLRYVDTIGQLAIDQATLTHSAFIRLSGAADAETGELHIDRIRAALDSGSSLRITRIVRESLFGQTQPRVRQTQTDA